MKNTILFLAAVGCLVLPTLTYADPLPSKGDKATKKLVASTAPKPASDRAIYYISTEAATGSHIPMVRRSYGGHIDNASSPATYGATQIQSTGALDVGGALVRLDPSISFGRGR